MKAWVIEKFGSFDDLVLKEVPTPAATPGRVLVRVRMAGLNFADGVALRGHYQVRITPPYVLGSELSGEVVDAGGCAGFSPGDRVAAQVPCGSYGEYLLVEPERLVKLPGAVDFAQGAALLISYTTAHVALFSRGGLKKGETVLVHAAAGGAGLATTQLAHHAGARVIATAGSDDKCALAAANGADHVLNYRAAPWVDAVRAIAPDGVDLVFDPVGGDTTLDSVRVMGWGGRLMIVGFAGGGPAAIPANRLLVKSLSALGVFWSFERDTDAVRAIQAELVGLCAEGGIRPHIGGIVPMADLHQGLHALEERRTSGKLVLDLG